MEHYQLLMKVHIIPNHIQHDYHAQSSKDNEQLTQKSYVYKTPAIVKKMFTDKSIHYISTPSTSVILKTATAIYIKMSECLQNACEPQNQKCHIP
jgi:hypothetical protein